MGGAMRDRHTYYITEFDLGYSMLAFPSTRSLNNSEPKSIVTLPYPFHGTDNTVFNGTAYYNYNDMLVAYNINTGDTKELRLNISATMLYNNSNSRVDVQADEHGIWLLHRRKGEDYMTASRIQPISLKVLSSWPLPAVLPSRFCNAVIRCGLLYTVECGDGYMTVSAIYDFYAHMYVNGKQTKWNDLNSLSSMQYDPNSKSITIFDKGSIYTVSAS
ncbi:Olfactomedin-like domain protein [Oesophagostomum dentatum]|uniref:Olfactomedin-like domain protein n=1 Tax=Oesophagostomum dentatum TaxID=61180 RepID=A0A0B1TMQ0_OESDE|nr:Olfactomedin-like domain protein [Oesophagostomum dentatum]